MSKVTIKMKPGWEKALSDQITRSPEWARIQEQANQQAQSVVARVNAEMSGGDADAIHVELVRRLSGNGVKPNDAELRRVAASIASGTFS